MLKKVLSFMMCMLMLVSTLPALSVNAEALTTEETELNQFSGELSLSVMQKETDITAHSIALHLENSLNSQDAEISVYYSENVNNQTSAESVIGANQKASFNGEKYLVENLKADTDYLFVAVASKEGLENIVSDGITVSTLAEDITQAPEDKGNQNIVQFNGNEQETAQALNTESDTNAPEIKSITVTKEAINGGFYVKIAVEATDDLSGINGGIMLTYNKPISKLKDSQYLMKDVDGLYTANLSIGKYGESGLWQIDSIRISDTMNNTLNAKNSKLYPSDSTAIDLSAGDFTIEGTTYDNKAPELKSISVDKTTVKTGEYITITVEASDDVSGIRSVSLNYNNMKYGYLTLYKKSEGIYTTTTLISKDSNLGLCQPDNIYIEDYAYNSTSKYNSITHPSDAEAIDLSAGNFTVEENTANGPNISSISVDKKTVTGGEVVTVTAEATDEISTFLSINMSYKKPITGETYNLNLSKKSDNIYQGTISISNYEEAGVWKMDTTSIHDVAGYSIQKKNIEYYPNDPAAVDLSEYNFTVEGTLSDTKAPELKSISVDKSTVTGGEFVTLTVEATDDVSGISGVSVQYRSPSNKLIESMSLTKKADNIFMASIPINEYEEAGLWQVMSLTISDNTTRFSYIEEQTLGSSLFGKKADLSGGNYTVSGTKADTTVPVLNSISIDKNTVALGDTVTIRVSVSDAEAGIKYIRLTYNNPNGMIAPIQLEKQEDGSYMGIMSAAQIGKWVLWCVSLEDNVRNQKYYIDKVNTPDGFPRTNTIVRDFSAYNFEAKAAVEKNTVNFDLRNGITVAPVTVETGSKLTEPEKPSKTGYKFEGWYKEAGCVNAWNFENDTVTADMTLYAKWTEVRVNVSFDTQGGTAVSPYSLLQGSPIPQPTAPTKTGYAFGGWYTEPSCVNAWTFGPDSVMADTILYAKWKEINVTEITLDTSNLSLVKGNTQKINVTVSPVNALNKAISWLSSDTNVAIVDAYGTVTAINAGTATITAIAKDTGTIKATCEIVVTAPQTTEWTKGNDGDVRLYREGNMVKNEFAFDGNSTYFLQENGTPMKDRLTYHPDGEHLIYLDENGHELFNTFKYCKSVGYTCYFDSNGYLYKDKITFINNKPYYLDGDGRMRQTGWFRFANGVDYGYANADGTLMSSGFSYDPWGRVVFYHWNGMVARGLISDGAWYYSMDTTDGHYLGQFPVH